ncbi:MFS transporter [Luteimicrobium sp. DT211]|uniref:MFS transporter n=1 Tax=Luteimicrobium sp. DT211 TaxID=3393412 RepID=UPI003CE7288F
MSALPTSPARAQAAPSPASSGRRSNPWLTLVAVAFGLFMVGLDGSVVSIANPEIGRALDASTADLQWVTNSYLLALAATLILGGKLGDRFGRRRFYLIGVVGFTLASVAIGLSGSIGEVVAFRAVQGLFGGLLMPNTLGLLREVFPPRKFGMAVGIWAMVSSVSTALGPIIGGLLVEHVGWESVFFLNAPVGVVAILVSALVLPKGVPAAAKHQFDVAGVVLLAVGLVVLVYGVVQAQTWGWGSAKTLATIVVGALVLVGFGWFEARREHALLPMRLFRSSALTVGTIITVVNFFVLLGVIFFVMLYLQNVRGLSPVEAGVWTLPLSLASVAASPLGAAVTGRFGPRVSMPIGMGLQAVAAALMLLWSADSSYALMWPPFVALGLGVGMVMAASSDAIVGNAPVRDGGVAGGLQATALQVGGALGTSVLMSLIAVRVNGTWPAELASAGIPAAQADALGGAADAVALGVAPVGDGMPASLGTAVTQASDAAFLNGVHLAAGVTAVLCVLAAVTAAVGVRRGAHEPASDGEPEA